MTYPFSMVGSKGFNKRIAQQAFGGLTLCAPLSKPGSINPLEHRLFGGKAVSTMASLKPDCQVLCNLWFQLRRSSASHQWPSRSQELARHRATLYLPTTQGVIIQGISSTDHFHQVAHITAPPSHALVGHVPLGRTGAFHLSHGAPGALGSVLHPSREAS